MIPKRHFLIRNEVVWRILRKNPFFSPECLCKFVIGCSQFYMPLAPDPEGPTTSLHCSGISTGCVSLGVSSSSYTCWHTGVFTSRHRRTSQTTYPSRLLMATAVTSGLLTADSPTLVVRPTRRWTLGDRAFPVAAARALNSLPPAVRDAPSLRSFRSRLKTRRFELTLA